MTRDFNLSPPLLPCTHLSVCPSSPWSHWFGISVPAPALTAGGHSAWMEHHTHFLSPGPLPLPSPSPAQARPAPAHNLHLLLHVLQLFLPLAPSTGRLLLAHLGHHVPTRARTQLYPPVGRHQPLLPGGLQKPLDQPHLQGDREQKQEATILQAKEQRLQT